MERVIAVKMVLDGGESVKELETIQEALSAIEDELRNVSKASAQKTAEEAFRELNKVVEENVLSIQELGAAADNYKNIARAAGEESPVGQEAIRKAAEMEQQMNDINESVAQLSERGSNLNASLQLGQGIIAGYTAFQGVMAAVGVEDENLLKVLTKLQAAQSALAGITELRNTLDRKSLFMTKAQIVADKAATIAKAAYAAVVGTTTGALKVFRIALASTGIGAIIVGIGLLIANFDTVTKAVQGFIKKLGGLKQLLWLLLGPIGALVLAYKFLFGEVEDGTDAMREAQRKANEEAEKLHKAKIKALEEERAKQEELIDEIQKRGKIQKSVDDLAILQAKARGASETEIFNIQKKQNEVKLAMAKQEYEAKEEIIRINHEIAKAEYERFKLFLETQALQAGWTEQQRQRDLQRLEEAKEEYLKNEEEKRLQNRITLETIEAENQIFLNNRNKQVAAANKKREAEEKKERDRLLKLQEDYERDLTDLKIENIEDENERAMAKLLERFERERQALIEKYGQETELEKQLMIQKENEILALEAKFEEKRKEAAEKIKKAQEELEKAEQAKIEEEFQAKLDQAQFYIDQANMALETATAVNDLLNQLGENRIKQNEENRDAELANLESQKQKELNVEGLTAKEKALIEKKFAEQEYKTKLATAEANDKIAEKQFKRNKAIQIASAAVNTAAAILKAIAMFGPPPSPAGIAAITSAGIIGAAQVATIAATKFQGSAASISPPNITIPDVPDDTGGTTTGGTGGGSDEILPGTDTSSLLNPNLTVSIVEVNKVQESVNDIEEISTL